ncbi:MAG: hypothetical protein JW850_15265 [Thermoflexales bacterium]|nr:hypothetical protein [Thermoflexales bacterium]
MKKHRILTAFCLGLALLLALAGAAHAQGPYDPLWSTLDSGGGHSAGAVYTVTGTIGQPAAGLAAGSVYTLASGFWPGLQAAISAPAAPALISPAHRSITHTAALTLVWGTSAGAAGYQLDFHGSQLDMGSATFSPTVVLAAASYTWTVAAYDSQGRLGAYAPVRAFAVTGPPVSVTLSGPFTPSQPIALGRICGSLSFSDTGDVSRVTVSYTHNYPSVNRDGLPRRYDVLIEGSNFTATLTLCYNEADLLVAGIDLAQEGDLHVYRYAGGGQGWEEYSEIDQAANTITAHNLTKAGVFGLGVPPQGYHPTAVMLKQVWAAARRVPWLTVLALVGLASLTAWARQARRKALLKR